MNKENLLASSLFLSFVIVLVANFLIQPSTDQTLEFVKLVVLGIALVYVLTYLGHIIIVQKFRSLKRWFYDIPINKINKVMKVETKLTDELYHVVYLSLLTNLASLYFLSLSTPNQILTRIPGFEGIDVLGEEISTRLFSFDFFNLFTRLDFFLPFTIIGTVIVMSLRFVNRKKDLGENEKIRGNNAILAFLYAMLGILMSQLILKGLQIVEIGIPWNDLGVVLLLMIVFSLLGIPSSMFIAFMDKFVLSRIKSH